MHRESLYIMRTHAAHYVDAALVDKLKLLPVIQGDDDAAETALTSPVFSNNSR